MKQILLLILNIIALTAIVLHYKRVEEEQGNIINYYLEELVSRDTPDDKEEYVISNMSMN